MAIKDDYIKIRVSKEQKKLFKRVAELKGITLTELLVGGTEERALREINKIEGAESLEERVAEVEKKLQEIKLKLESQSSKKKSLLKTDLLVATPEWRVIKRELVLLKTN